MQISFSSGFSFNSVIWISSLPDSEQGPARRMTEDMESLSSQIGFDFQHVDVSSIDELSTLLCKLSIHACKHKLRPILNFDMHGCKDKGLLISGANEFVSWDWLAVYLRKLNTCTENNLCVIGAACFGLRAVMPIKLDQPTPFFILLAPENKVSLGFLEKNIFPFYKVLFESGNINDAYQRYLSNKFSYFHCEKMLFIVVARYIKKGCKGKTAQERRERLLSEVFLAGMEKTKENLQNVRKKIKEGLLPNQALLDRYAKTFLINKACSFNIDQLLEFMDADQT